MQLYNDFHSNFDIVPANNSSLLQKAYSLRYKIYCLEHHLENPTDFSDGKEQDNYDARAQHCLIRHRRSGSFIGIVRVVMPDSRDVNAPFPLEEHCQEKTGWPQAASQLPFRLTLAEVSRFGVSKEVRRDIDRSRDESKVFEGKSKANTANLKRAHLLSTAIVGLAAVAIGVCYRSGITHFYGLMEPALTRFLARFGVVCRPIGPCVEHRGKRQPTLGWISEILHSSYNEYPDVSKIITEVAEHKEWAEWAGLKTEPCNMYALPYSQRHLTLNAISAEKR